MTYAVETLFGRWEVLEPPAPGKARRKTPERRGYVAPPGTGPEGETCGSCGHCVRSWNDKFAKCRLVEKFWTGGYATDVRRRAPACKKWEKER